MRREYEDKGEGVLITEYKVIDGVVWETVNNIKSSMIAESDGTFHSAGSSNWITNFGIYLDAVWGAMYLNRNVTPRAGNPFRSPYNYGNKVRFVAEVKETVENGVVFSTMSHNSEYYRGITIHIGSESSYYKEFSDGIYTPSYQVELGSGLINQFLKLQMDFTEEQFRYKIWKDDTLLLDTGIRSTLTGEAIPFTTGKWDGDRHGKTGKTRIKYFQYWYGDTLHDFFT